MKIISLIFIAIIIPLTSFPALIKAPSGSSSRGGGRGFVGGGGGSFFGGRGGGGFVGGRGGGANSGSKSGGPGGYRSGGDNGYRSSGDSSAGYKGGTKPGTPPVGGGDPGTASTVVIPKPLEVELPKECKEEVKECVTTHITGDGGEEPKHGGSCCTKLKNAKPCLCKFLTSKDRKLQKAANGVLGGCHFIKEVCINMPMPQTCRPEVRHCVNEHMYGKAGQPKFHGACCMKFKTSKSCVTKFLSSPDPKLSEAAKGVIRGCHFIQ